MFMQCKFSLPPVLRFVLLGLLLWCGDNFMVWRASYQVNSPSDEQLDIAYQGWAQRYGVSPNSQQREAIRQAEISDEILFLEAIRYKIFVDDPVVNQRLLKNAEFLGFVGSESEIIAMAIAQDLHKRDELIRRHLIQRMKALGRAQAHPVPAPDETELYERYSDQAWQWKTPPRVAIKHVFFSQDHPAAGERVQAAQRDLAETDLSDQRAYSLGDQFLLGNDLAIMGLPKLRDMFGEQFISALMDEVIANDRYDKIGVWLGPLPSAYGLHLVKVTELEGESYRAFNEVKNSLVADYVRELESQALTTYIAKLRDKYRFAVQ